MLLPPCGSDREVSRPRPRAGPLGVGPAPSPAAILAEEEGSDRRGAWECRSGEPPAAPRPAEACNLWTQALHANRIQALTARPETDDARRLAPVGVEFGMAEED